MPVVAFACLAHVAAPVRATVTVSPFAPVTAVQAHA